MKIRFLKLFVWILSVLFLLSCGKIDVEKNSGGFGDYGSDTNESLPVFDENFNGLIIAGMNDTSTMGMVKFMDNSDKNIYEDSEYLFEIYERPYEVLAALEKDSVKYANVPGNMAAEIYNDTNGGISVIAISDLGTFNFVERQERLNYFSELKGQTIYFTDYGGTTDWVMRYLFNKNYIDARNEVSFIYENDYDTIISKMLTDDQAIGILPLNISFPASEKYPEAKFRNALSLMGEWVTVETESTNGYVSTVTVVKNDYLKENPEDVINFLARYKLSVEFVKAEENRTESAELIEKYGVLSQEQAYSILPFCKMDFIIGNDMKDRITEYYNIMYNFAPDSIGGALPGDEFYYLG
ncbi:MAG: hypothetical protein LBR74_06850 [Eubacterium sp.]|jgi:NitT/TauT family transport system substrate-binding protein|nr:hypothetical protein [Eubacterium sp.]